MFTRKSPSSAFLPIEELSKLTNKQLQEQLAKRGAHVGGRKEQLVERLRAYIQNNNFQIGVPEDVLPNFSLPPKELFKDINADMELPQITQDHIDLFSASYNKNTDTAKLMYKGKFLSYIRHCKQDDNNFFLGLVHAQMTKRVTYNVSLKVSLRNEIEGSHCDCTAGEGGEAHCKHVIVVLLGIENMVREGFYVTRETCTERLQTFHRPKKNYKGSPLKAKSMTKKTSGLHFDPRPAKYRNLSTSDRVYNLSVPFPSTMPYKQVLSPANPYALEVDHTYSNMNSHYPLLKKLFLVDVSDEDIVDIEKKTCGQNKNSLWKELRSYRITASNFGKICHSVSEEAKRNIVNNILNPQKLQNKAVMHGILHEPIAVQQHMAKFMGEIKAEECGLFLMKDKPYLGGSPDRLLCVVTVLEVKCPYSARDEMITPESVPYLYINEKGEYALKSNHSYMYQVQGQLAVTGRLFCDFVVWTFKSMKAISINRDDNFISNMLLKLDEFYHQYFLPALLKKYFYRDYYEVSLFTSAGVVRT